LSGLEIRRSIFLKHSNTAQKDSGLIPLAISGHPSGDKNLIEDILSQDGLTHFLHYIRSLGLVPGQNHRRIYILDIVGSGTAIEFFIHRLKDIFTQAGAQLPEIKIIAINGPDGWVTSHDKITDEFVGASVRAPLLFLGMSKLARTLDTMPLSLRVTPEFHAWCWPDWMTDPTKIPQGGLASKVITAIKHHFSP
jgi:hypothetical protein